MKGSPPTLPGSGGRLPLPTVLLAVLAVGWSAAVQPPELATTARDLPHTEPPIEARRGPRGDRDADAELHNREPSAARSANAPGRRQAGLVSAEPARAFAPSDFRGAPQRDPRCGGQADRASQPPPDTMVGPHSQCSSRWHHQSPPRRPRGPRVVTPVDRPSPTGLTGMRASAPTDVRRPPGVGPCGGQPPAPSNRHVHALHQPHHSNNLSHSILTHTGGACVARHRRGSPAAPGAPTTATPSLDLAQQPLESHLNHVLHSLLGNISPRLRHHRHLTARGLAPASARPSGEPARDVTAHHHTPTDSNNLTHFQTRPRWPASRRRGPLRDVPGQLVTAGTRAAGSARRRRPAPDTRRRPRSPADAVVRARSAPRLARRVDHRCHLHHLPRHLQHATVLHGQHLTPRHRPPPGTGGPPWTVDDAGRRAEPSTLPLSDRPALTPVGRCCSARARAHAPPSVDAPMSPPSAR